MKVLTLLRRGSSNQVVEYMEIALARRGTGNTRALEVVVQGLDAAEPATVRELKFSVFPKTGGIRVEERAGTAKRFEDKLRGRDLSCEFGMFFAWRGDA